jgi:hypothetical protein
MPPYTAQQEGYLVGNRMALEDDEIFDYPLCVVLEYLLLI